MAVNIDAEDKVAREGVHRVESKVDTHTAVCERLAIEAANWRKETTDKLDSITSQIRGATLSIIVLLLGVIGYLLSKHGLTGG